MEAAILEAEHAATDKYRLAREAKEAEATVYEKAAVEARAAAAAIELEGAKALAQWKEQVLAIPAQKSRVPEQPPAQSRRGPNVPGMAALPNVPGMAALPAPPGGPQQGSAHTSAGSGRPHASSAPRVPGIA